MRALVVVELNLAVTIVTHDLGARQAMNRFVGEEVGQGGESGASGGSTIPIIRYTQLGVAPV